MGGLVMLMACKHSPTLRHRDSPHRLVPGCHRTPSPCFS
ncbi:hypothetical protein XCR_2406 [Xanthomonas campestris pv. raphani 756C]|nr:hypothetical protein XCR_2406 [Xanthomonas campestris pv. raphani 756C]